MSCDHVVEDNGDVSEHRGTLHPGCSSRANVNFYLSSRLHGTNKRAADVLETLWPKYGDMKRSMAFII